VPDAGRKRRRPGESGEGRCHHPFGTPCLFGG
jgi:hypothetical protein